MAHENLKGHLYADAGKAFVSNLTRAVYIWASRVPDIFYNYRIFEELTIRYATDDKTRLGLDRFDHYRFDAVFFIQPGQRALNQHQCYSAGVELKNSKADLMQDDKIVKYLSWTDFFFIGVPSALIEDAKEKIASVYGEYPNAKGYIGLMNVETGEVVSLPKRQYLTLDNVCKIQEQIIYNVLFNDIKTVSFKLEDVSIEQAQFNDAPSLPISSSDSPSESHSDADAPSLAPKSETREDNREYRKELAERKAERLKKLSARGESLPSATAAVYNSLDANAKEVFWGIVDSQDGDQTRESLSNITGLSLQKIDRSIVPLCDSGIISREGGKKFGKYVVNLPIDKHASCSTCTLKYECKFVGASSGNCQMHQ